MTDLAQFLIAAGVGFPSGLAINRWVTPRVIKYRKNAKRVNAEIKRFEQKDDDK